MSTVAIVQVLTTAHATQHMAGGADPIPELVGMKAGVLPPGMFSGQPLSAQVTFGTAYADDGYSITLSVLTDGTKTFALSVSNKTAAGFQVNLNSRNISNLIEIGWHALPISS